MKAIISILTVLIFSAFSIAPEQSRIINGIVKDEAGNLLPGVSVVVKGTSNGTVTDINGAYQIPVNVNDKYLVFTYIGMEQKEVRITKSNRINVVLKTSRVALEEIVFTEHESKKSYLMTTADMSAPVKGYVAGGRKGRHPGRYAKQSHYQSSYAPEAGYVQHNTEGYSTIHENGFKDVTHNPLSTFSIDVDKASYSNVRRFLNMGQLPPKDAVRIEEMINYFNYDYPEPQGKHPFSVYTEISRCPWNESHQLLHVGLKGKSIDKSELPASNLVLLIDVSGSMSAANKLPLLKQAFRMLVNELRPEDRVAMVVYAGAAGLVLESTPGSRKEEIIAALDQLQSGGSTAGGAGLKLAYKVAQENFIEEGNNRIILATDGDFNVGASSNAEMERMIEEKREHGVFMTVLGFGMGNYKDDKMEIIADKGNGNYAYIDNIQEARKVFITEFGGTLFTIAKDVKFQIEFNPARVKGYRLVGYENRLLNDEDFNDDKKDAGEMGAGHTVTALYEVIPAGSDESLKSIDPLKYQSSREKQKASAKVKADLSAELMTVKLRYKQPDGNTSTKVEIAVKGKVLELDETSDNFRFSAAIAEFGLILRNSQYREEASIEQVISLAKSARGEDEEGYRSEFLKLVKLADALKDWTGTK
ncbi:MAG: von Willebrand factor type A domain-containing protein [Bacteroidales bacterium]|nr:von Willebrand factor type A domain-containing protein [Bacteroidales bacterium]